MIFLASAIITPPDVMTQLLLAIPLLGLYEVLVFYAKTRQV
jgi:sec-independent protein translocase protein TatC